MITKEEQRRHERILAPFAWSIVYSIILTLLFLVIFLLLI